MAAWAFLSGALLMLAVGFIALPWIRSHIQAEHLLTRLRIPSAAALAVLAAASLGGGAWLDKRAAERAPLLDRNLQAALESMSGASPTTSGALPSPASGSGASPNPNHAAGSMGDAVASLEKRLALGGGSDGDWELLAKSYEFLGRPDDAARARRHQLPAPGATSAVSGGNSPAGASATASTPVPSATAPTLSASSLKLLAEAGRDRRERRFKEAAALYARLAASRQLNADGWADYADTAAALGGRKLAGTPEDYLAHALALDPDHPKALWLEASAQEEQGRIAEAISTWQHLARVLPPQSEDARIVAANLARDAAALPPAPSAASTGAPAPVGDSTAASAAPGTPASSGRHVAGDVTLAAALGARVPAGATLFIVAKSVDAPGPPLAVIRRPAGQWPVTFTLDDSQAMMPGRNLSSGGRIQVEARISASGAAMPARGDLRGKSPVLGLTDRGSVHITIDEVVS